MHIPEAMMKPFRVFGGHSVKARVSWLMIVLPAVLTLAAPPRMQAEVIASKPDEVWITGPISENDAKQFDLLSSSFEYERPFIHLDSTGGDVVAAMKIGRIIRKYEGSTVVNNSYKCYSSCALIFISGVTRVLNDRAELGLHRPYLADAPLSRGAIEKQVPLMLSTVKSFVSEMGVTENFYQMMFNTEPSEILIYRSGTVEKLVPMSDPTFDEILTASLAGR